MPKVNWGISAGDVDDFDREAQYKPYDGPVPVNGVYRFKVKKLQFVAATGAKLPQLRIGLEIAPRAKAEKQYEGYYIMLFPPVSNRTQFRYVPFLDAIGVSGREFETGTITDEDGNIKKIGRWRFTGDVFIKGEIKDDTDQHGNPRKDIGWMGVDTGEAVEEEEDDEDYDFDPDSDDDEDGGWDDE
jgi:hypothetical protein